MSDPTRRQIALGIAGTITAVLALTESCSKVGPPIPTSPVNTMILVKEELTYSETPTISTAQTPVSDVCVYRNGMLQSVLQKDYSIVLGVITPTMIGNVLVQGSWINGDALSLVYMASA